MPHANERNEPHVTPGPATPGPGTPHEALTVTEREQIARRARELWREEGYPEGRDRAHWEQAEMEVLKGRRSY